MSSPSPDPAGITIAHIVLGLDVGGLERVVVNLVGGLGNTYRPLVICLEESGIFAAELERRGIAVHALHKKTGIDWRAIGRIAAICRTESVRLIHTHNPAPHFHGIMAALWAGVPVRVHTKHGRNYPNDPKKVWINRIASRFTDVIVTVSDDARDVALQIEHVAPAKVRRIWNGVDTDRYQPTGSLAPRPPVLGTVARLSPEKDQKTMLAAFQTVAREMPEARLVFAGDGPSATELKTVASDLGIASRVDFLGTRADVPSILNTFSLFTLSSTTEGLSMTLIEAMSAGLPIVATEVGGNREVVHPPECGLLVPARNPRALADAWLTLLRDPARRSQMGASARARVIERFSLRQMTAQYRELYDALLTRKDEAMMAHAASRLVGTVQTGNTKTC